MKYSSKTGTLASQSTQCLVLGLKDAKKYARAQGHSTLLQAATTDFKDAIGQVLAVPLPSKSKVKRLIVLGGADGQLNQAQFRKLANLMGNRLSSTPSANAVIALLNTKVKSADTYWKSTTLFTAISNSLYSFNHHKSKPPAPAKLKAATLLTSSTQKSAGQKAALRSNALKKGLDFCRDLGNQPPNICNPSYLLKEARKLAKANKTTVSALDEKRMTGLGMGAFMSVTQGSDTPGKMIIIQYKGAAASKAPVALVGKGITFDTGGISLKPPPAMDEMKFDMCGAAAVLGVTKSVIEAKLPINLVTIVAAAENMPSGRASRPGDIVTSHAGKTIEILNTDAEGRLVLCDALSYVSKFKPKAVIDVATLTGACIVALGSHASAVFANDEKLAAQLLAAGETSGDRAWQLPLWDEYQPQLRSNFADMANVGGREAGSITAACFLSRFTEDYSWAHMDVAGSAFHGGARKGASGRPVSLLFQYLLDCE